MRKCWYVDASLQLMVNQSYRVKKVSPYLIQRYLCFLKSSLILCTKEGTRERVKD